MGTSLRHPPEPKFLPPHMETELLVFDVPVLLQSVLIFHNIVPVCFSLIFSILFLSSSDYGILCSLLWVGIGKKLSLSDHTHSFKSFYLQGPLRRYPAIYYEIQRYLLKKIQDTRNIVHRTMMPQSPSKQAPWDLTQFSQLPSAAPSYFPESYQQFEISSLSKVILVLGKARSHRVPNVGCRGAESPE